MIGIEFNARGVRHRGAQSHAAVELDLVAGDAAEIAHVGDYAFQTIEGMRVERVRSQAAARQLNLLGADRDAYRRLGDRLRGLRHHDGAGLPHRHGQTIAFRRTGLSLEDIHVADELGYPARGWRFVELPRGRDLLDTARIHHAD